MFNQFKTYSSRFEVTIVGTDNYMAPEYINFYLNANNG